MIERHQLEALRGHPTFLLSVDDFANSLMAAGVMRELVRHPGVFVTAMLYHPWMRPLRAVATHFANVVEAVLWARSRRRASQSPPPVATEEPSGPEEYLNHSRRLLSVPGPRRRLAQTVQQGAAAVQPLAGASPVQADALATIPPLLASARSTAAFVWPPASDFSLQTCPLGLSTLGIGRQALSVTKLYYQNFNKPPRPIDRSLRATLPDWAGWNVTIPPPPARQGAQSWASVAFHWVLSLAGVTPAELVAFFTTNQPWSLQWMLDTAVECDLVDRPAVRDDPHCLTSGVPETDKRMCDAQVMFYNASRKYKKWHGWVPKISCDVFTSLLVADVADCEASIQNLIYQLSETITNTYAPHSYNQAKLSLIKGDLQRGIQWSFPVFKAQDQSWWESYLGLECYKQYGTYHYDARSGQHSGLVVAIGYPNIKWEDYPWVNKETSEVIQKTIGQIGANSIKKLKYQEENVDYPDQVEIRIALYRGHVRSRRW